MFVVSGFSRTRAHALAIVLAMMSTLSAQELPVQVGVGRVDGNLVEWVLVSHAPYAASAWAIEFITTQPDGSKNQKVETTDNYITTAHPDFDPHLTPKLLDAGAMRTFTSRIGGEDGRDARTVETRVIAVIFENGSAIGDQRIIDNVLSRRQTDRDTYAALLNDLRAARSNGGRREDALALVAHLTENRKLYPDPTIVQGLLENLGRALTSPASDVETALATLERMVAAEHAAAVKHSAQRPR